MGSSTRPGGPPSWPTPTGSTASSCDAGAGSKRLYGCWSRRATRGCSKGPLAGRACAGVGAGVLVDQPAAVAESQLRIEVRNPELLVVGADTQLDRLDPAPAALRHHGSEQAAAEALAAGGRLHPDLLDLGARSAAGRDPDRRGGDPAVAGEREEAAARVVEDRLDVLPEVRHHAALMAEER